MIGDLAKRLNIEDTINRRLNPYIAVSTKKKSPKDLESIFDDDSFFYTAGFGSIEYKVAYNDKKVKHGSGRYIINNDTIPSSVMRVENFTDLKKQAKSNPRLMWVIKNSNLSSKLFKIAKDNPYTKIPFCVKIEEIYDEMKKKYGSGSFTFCSKERGIMEAERKKLQEKVRREKGKMTGNWK